MNAVFEPHRHRHWSSELPYRALVYICDSDHGTPLYRVAGSDAPARKASKALRHALTVHGGSCHYCNARAECLTAFLGIDHVEPRANAGSDLLHNLVIACRECNGKKSTLPVEAFHRNAGRAWLLGVQALIRARLALLPEEDEAVVEPSPCAPRRPERAGAGDP